MKRKEWKYKGIGFLLAICLSLLSPLAALGESEETGGAPELSAEAAVVMDLDTGDILYGKAENEAIYPGGLTKIMTVLLLAENYDLTKMVSFSEILYDLEEDSLKLELQPGEEITLYDAACAIMLSSANDVANGIAEYIAGSPDAFAVRMNERAAELGCVNTHFSNPHGLYREDLYTCAGDLALIAKAAYENEAFREICRLTEYTIPATNLTESPRQLLNYHQMIQEGSGYYQEWCLGGKSSYTSQGLNSIVTFGSSGEKNLVSVVLGVPDADAAYEETADLFYYGFGEASDVKEAAEGAKKQARGQTGLEPISASEEAGETLTPPTTKDTLQQTEEELQTTESTGETAGESAAEELTENTENRAEESAGETEAGTQKSENSIDTVLNRLEEFWNVGRGVASRYAKDHFKQVFALGCLFMLFLLLLIIVLFRRAVRGSKSRRERERAERIWKEKESLIETMSVEELEEELRRREKLEREMIDGGTEKKDSDGINPASYPRGDE